MEDAVRQAVSVIWARYREPITLDALASEVFVSPFHFLRVFTRATGVTPGRYLSAVRMFEAKRLLLTTSLKVSTIVCSVGYSSIGTFTTRFTRCVGMTPNQYREPSVGELLVAAGPGYCRMPSAAAMRLARTAAAPRRPDDGRVTAVLDLPPGTGDASVFVGLFGEAVPQAPPVAWAGVRQFTGGAVTLADVPPGRWTAVAMAQPLDPRTRCAPLLGVATRPVVVRPGQSASLRLDLHRMGPADPPMAVTLASPLPVAAVAASAEPPVPAGLSRT